MKRLLLLLFIPMALLMLPTGNSLAGSLPNDPVYLGISVVGTCDQDVNLKEGCIYRNVRFTNTTATTIDFGGFQIGGADIGFSLGLGNFVPSPGSCWLLRSNGGGVGHLLPGRSCLAPVIAGATNVGTFTGFIDMLAPFSNVVLLSIAVRVTGVAPNSPVHFGKSVVGTCDQDASITAGCIHRVARFTNMTDAPITFNGIGVAGGVGASFGLGDQSGGTDRCLALIGGPGLAPLHTCTVPVIGGATAIGPHAGAVELLSDADVVLSIPLCVFGVVSSV